MLVDFWEDRNIFKLFADDTKLYTVFRDSISATCLQSCSTAILNGVIIGSLHYFMTYLDFLYFTIMSGVR